MVDKVDEVVGIIEVESARAPRKAIVVLDDITYFSPKLQCVPKCTLRESNTVEDVAEREQVMFV